jgi:hypothetical protein
MKYCAIIVRSKAQSGTLLARHVVFGCKGGTGGRVPIEMRGQVWDVTMSLHKRPRPIDPLAARPRLVEARPVLALGSPVIPFTSTIPRQLASPANDEVGANPTLQSQLEAWLYAPVYGPNNHRPNRRSERCDDKIPCELRHPVCDGRPS